MNEYPPEFNEELKEVIRKRDNYTCQLCGCEYEFDTTYEVYDVIRGYIEIKKFKPKQISSSERVVIHHINYDKQNCSMSNLITLCGRCNVLVNANRDYWMNYFSSRTKGENQR